MKLTEKDIELFKALSKSQLGTDFIDYLDRLADHVCDSRTWGPNDTRESSNRAAEVITKEVRNRITPKKEPTAFVLNEHE